MFREVTQLMDIISMDFNSIVFNPRYIVASVMFTTLCLNLLDISINENILIETFQSDKIFANLFKEFIKESMNIEYNEILSTIRFCSKYLNLKFIYDLPLSVQINPDIDDVNKINLGYI
jgi:hypothetical protein